MFINCTIPVYYAKYLMCNIMTKPKSAKMREIKSTDCYYYTVNKDVHIVS